MIFCFSRSPNWLHLVCVLVKSYSFKSEILCFSVKLKRNLIGPRGSLIFCLILFNLERLLKAIFILFFFE